MEGRSEDQSMNASITLRQLSGAGRDLQALRELAERDSRPIPEERMIAAEVAGRLLAAIGIDSGEMIADPFSPTVELRSLLELRRAQLRRQTAPRRATRRRRLAPRDPARAALAGSPPGAGGRLLDLR
jgi:hypothetical protein